MKAVVCMKKEEEDEMRVRSEFLKGILSSLLTKALKKKLGKEIEVGVGEVTVKIGEKAHIHLVVDADMPKQELKNLIFGKFDI